MNSYVRQTDEDEEPRLRRPPCRTIQSDIFGGLLAVMLCLVFNVSAAGVLFGHGALRPYESEGVVLTILATASSLAVLVLTSPLPVVTSADAFVAAMFAQQMQSVKEDDVEPFAMQIAALAILSLMLGGMMWVLGAAQAGKLVQFLPTPVMAGYLAAVGYILLESASFMTTGCSLLDLSLIHI